jgi:hypothetical protein
VLSKQCAGPTFWTKPEASLPQFAAFQLILQFLQLPFEAALPGTHGPVVNEKHDRDEREGCE